MRIGIYLSYVGLGANLLHLSYCHQIAKKYGPVSIITLCKNLEETLEDDPLIENVYYIDKFQKRLTDIYKLSNIIKKLNFNKLLVFYPSMRIYLSAKLAGIHDIAICIQNAVRGYSIKNFKSVILLRVFNRLKVKLVPC